MTAEPMRCQWLRCNCTKTAVKYEQDNQLPDVVIGDRGFNSIDGKARLTKGHITVALPPCDADDLPAGGTRNAITALPPMADDVNFDQAPMPPPSSGITSNRKVTALPPLAFEDLDPVGCHHEYSSTRSLTESNLRQHNAVQVPAAPSPAAESTAADPYRVASTTPATHRSLPPMSDGFN